jgi:hypothetical protein
MTILPKSQPADDCFHRMALIRRALRNQMLLEIAPRSERVGAAASPDRLTEIRRYRGRAGSSFPFLPRRSALIPSRTLMHGSPWLRASEATRVRRRQINGLERLGRAIGVLIGVLEFALTAPILL